MVHGVIVSQFLAFKFGPNNLFRLLTSYRSLWLGLNHEAVHCKHSKGSGSPSAGSTGVDPLENIQGHHFWFREHIYHIYQHGPTYTYKFNLDSYINFNVNILISSSNFLPTRAIAEVCVAKTVRISSLLVMQISGNPVTICLSTDYPDQKIIRRGTWEVTFRGTWVGNLTSLEVAIRNLRKCVVCQLKIRSSILNFNQRRTSDIKAISTIPKQKNGVSSKFKCRLVVPVCWMKIFKTK